MDQNNLYANVLEAEKRIRPYIRTTFLDNSVYLSQQTGANVFLKHEEQQHTGSFKVRGAFNRILSLTREERQKGVTCGSTGNHGLAVAYASKLIGLQATVYLPETTSSLKVDKIKALGANVQPVPGDCLEAEIQAGKNAQESGKVFISPYNDSLVMAGQGTLGLELEKQLPNLDALFISVGGGGLIGGIASYLKMQKPSVEIIGVWPENAPAMSKCIEAGRIIDVPELPTLSESTAGGVELGSVTFEPCKHFIDKHILVSEEDIKAAMKLVVEKESILIEGAAGVAVAGFLKQADSYKGRNVAILLCGKNIPYAVFREIIQ
ncbi:threonine/serine dehydratase [Vampirovibrio sp.]|uniref:threonine/serine dehydratase n=1 Tax=Vampirovibrio sp. TaxID=2717857 RepID=UPI003593F324